MSQELRGNVRGWWSISACGLIGLLVGYVLGLMYVRFPFDWPIRTVLLLGNCTFLGVVAGRWLVWRMANSRGRFVIHDDLELCEIIVLVFWCGVSVLCITALLLPAVHY